MQCLPDASAIKYCAPDNHCSVRTRLKIYQVGPEPDICEERTEPEKEVMQQGMRAEQDGNAHEQVSLPIAVILTP